MSFLVLKPGKPGDFPETYQAQHGFALESQNLILRLPGFSLVIIPTMTHLSNESFGYTCSIVEISSLAACSKVIVCVVQFLTKVYVKKIGIQRFL